METASWSKQIKDLQDQKQKAIDSTPLIRVLVETKEEKTKQNKTKQCGRHNWRHGPPCQGFINTVCPGFFTATLFFMKSANTTSEGYLFHQMY